MDWEKLKPYIGLAVRALVLLLAAKLMKSNIVILNQVGEAIQNNLGEVVAYAIGLIGTAGVVVWSWWQKRQQAKMVVAVAEKGVSMPSTTPAEAVIDAVVEDRKEERRL